MLTLSGSIGGVGGLTASGPGSLTLSNTSNSFAGNVTVNGGTLAVLSIANSGVNSALGSGSTVTLGGATWSTPAPMRHPAAIAASRSTRAADGPG